MRIVKCIYPTGSDATAGIEIDAFLSETYSFENKITDKPSEGDGKGDTSTVTEEPDRLEVEAFIGATKFEVTGASLPGDAAELPDAYPRDRVVGAFEELKRLKETKQPMDIVTGLTTMAGMVITGLYITRDSETGADLSFSCTFMKAPVESSSSSAAPSTESAQGVANTGKSGTEAPAGNYLSEAADRWLADGQITQAQRDELRAEKGY